MIKYDIRAKSIIQVYLLLPFMIPLVVSGIIFSTIFGQLGVYGDLWTVGVALSVINFPFMLWSVNSRVNAINKPPRTWGPRSSRRSPASPSRHCFPGSSPVR